MAMGSSHDVPILVDDGDDVLEGGLELQTT